MDHKTIFSPGVFSQTYFHGTKADLRVGDLISCGFNSNYEERKLKHVYVSATLHAAVLAAALASGDGKERVYVVEATGKIEDDPNVTDKKFPGNPTMSYRSEFPFRIVGEVINWHGHTAEQLKAIRNGIQKLKDEGKAIILD